MIRTALLATAIVFAPPAVAQQQQRPQLAALPQGVPSGTYQLDRAHASITWALNHLGLMNYQARFNAVNATLTLDAANPQNSRLTATVDPASVETGFPFAQEKDFNAELRDDARFFRAAQFPEIRFESQSIRRTGERTAEVSGQLTLLGETRPQVMTVTFNAAMPSHPNFNVPVVGFSGAMVVKRSEFGMDALVPFVGDDVTVRIEAPFLLQR